MMRTTSRFSSRLFVLSLVAVLATVALWAPTALATNGVWIGTGNSTWSNTANWQDGFIADGVGATATFTNGGLGGNRTFTVDSTRTLGTLTVGENRSVHIGTSGGAVLIFDNNGSPSQVTLTTAAGNNFYIDVAFELKGDLNITNEKFADSAKHINFGTITNTSSGNVTITNNAGAQPKGGTVNFWGIISDGANGSVSLVQDNNNFDTHTPPFANPAIYALTLGNANTYSGPTTLKSGWLNLQNANPIQNSTLIMSGGTLQFSSLVTGNAFTLGGLSASTAGTGYDIALQNGAITPVAIALSVGSNNADTTYAGVLSSGGSLTKIGAGTLTLSGANSYSGATNVNKGTLLVNGDQSLATGAVTVASGATLGGTGTIGGAVTVEGGGIFSPGASAGTLNLGAGLTIAAGGIFNWENNTVNTLGVAGTNWDVANVNGTTTISSTAGTGSELELQFTNAGTSFSDTFWNTDRSWDFITGGVAGANVFDASNINIFINGAQQGSNNAIAGQGAFTTAVSGSNLKLVWTAILPGDADENGVVDAADYIALKSNFGMTSGATWAQGNFSDSYGTTGTVDWDDLQILMANFGTRSVDGAPAAPEPATLGLLAIGALALLRRRLRTA
jgi:autotransporter-associated beta strand protein